MTIIVRNDGEVTRVEESGVDYEGYLQTFIFENPDSLPLGGINDDSPLMIVGREFGTGTGPIDVLAIDADGHVYIVETKLYKNPDKRRIVAQLLDYGAALWQHSQHPTGLGETIAKMADPDTGSDLAGRIEAFYDLEPEDAEQTVDLVGASLRDGRFRFVVLMDHLNDKLRDLILYVNENSNFDIYAVVMQFYRHADVEIVIPKLFGTEVVKSGPKPAPTSRSSTKWMASRFFDATESLPADQQAAVKRLYAFCRDRASNINWSRGREGSFRVQFKQVYRGECWDYATDGKIGSLLVVHADGLLDMNFGVLTGHVQVTNARDQLAASLRSAFPVITESVEDATTILAAKTWAPHVETIISTIEAVLIAPFEEA